MVTWLILAALVMGALAAMTAYVVIRLNRALRLAAEDLADAERRVGNAMAHANRAHVDKRQAQRVLTILTEPLKDWDLADFPTGPTEGARHLRAIRDAYRIVAADAAQARMSIKVGDRARRRGWADEPLTAVDAGNRIIKKMRDLP